MPIHHAVLALLAEGESYGYELKQSFEEAIGPQWGELSIGHLYQVLERLLRDGHVTRRRVRQSERPDRAVYQLTEAGQQELTRWLETPFVRQTGYRDEFFLKLFVASRLGRDALEEVVRTQREAYLAELASLGQLRAEHNANPIVGLLIEAAVLHTEANLRLVEMAEASAPDLTRGRHAAGTATGSVVASAETGDAAEADLGR